MNDEGGSFLHSNEAEFRNLTLLVARERGLPESAIEKDYWVTHVLWALHNLDLTIWFKGGTSLSKGFGIIRRFSEDLDLKIAAEGLPHVRDWTGSDKSSKVRERSEFFDAIEELIEIPDMRVSRLSLLPKARGLLLTAEYPNLHEGDGLMRPFVQLEIGEARVEPYSPRPLSSWIHDFIERQGVLDEYIDNRPKNVRCVRPEVTVLDKLDAIQGKFAKRQPADFVRHYGDTAQIVQWLEDQGIDPDEVRELAADMKRKRDVRGDAFDPTHLAFNPRDDELWHALREEYGKLDLWYWD